jgi:Glycosyltransferase family 87
MVDLPAHASTGARQRWWNLLSFTVGFVALCYGLLVLYAFGPFVDTRSFWLPWSGPIYDPSLPLWIPHFVQSPVLALLLRPFGVLPFPIFAAAWTTLAAGTYWWLLRPLPPAPRLLALLAGFTFALNGNVEWALAGMAVLGMTRPWIWLLAAFTKITPFAGFGWFVLQRDWRAVGATCLGGALLVVVSMALLPGAWPTWIGMVLAFRDQTAHAGLLTPAIPLLPRLAVALVTLAWGVTRRQPPVLPVVLVLAQPDLQPWVLGYLAAVPRLRARSAGHHARPLTYASAAPATREPSASAFDTPRSSG